MVQIRNQKRSRNRNFSKVGTETGTAINCYGSTTLTNRPDNFRVDLWCLTAFCPTRLKITDMSCVQEFNIIRGLRTQDSAQYENKWVWVPFLINVEQGYCLIQLQTHKNKARQVYRLCTYWPQNLTYLPSATWWSWIQRTSWPPQGPHRRSSWYLGTGHAGVLSSSGCL